MPLDNRDRQILSAIVFRVRSQIQTLKNTNGNAPRHLTRQTTCVSHRKPTIDQITPLCASMQTDAWLWLRISRYAGVEGTSLCERQGHGYTPDLA